MWPVTTTSTSFPFEYKTPSILRGGRGQGESHIPQSSVLLLEMKVCRLASSTLTLSRLTIFLALLLGALSTTSPDPLTSLRAYLTSLPTPTAITSTIQTLTRLLLLHSALQTNSSHLVLGTSLTSLAVSLISGVAQGAGFNIREETQEDWTPDTVPTADPTHPQPTRKEKGKKATQGPGKRAVRIVRPLRDIGMKECAAWAWWAGVPIVGKEKWGWAGAKPGIGTLTKSLLSVLPPCLARLPTRDAAFIVGLEKDYPSTVSTIVRTCDKLAPKGEVSGACILCGRCVSCTLTYLYT